MFLEKVLLNVIYVLILSCGCETNFLIKICEEMMEMKNFLQREKKHVYVRIVFLFITL